MLVFLMLVFSVLYLSKCACGRFTTNISVRRSRAANGSNFIFVGDPDPFTGGPLPSFSLAPQFSLTSYNVRNSVFVILLMVAERIV